jgi:hypothetical protein
VTSYIYDVEIKQTLLDRLDRPAGMRPRAHMGGLPSVGSTENSVTTGEVYAKATCF